MGGDGDLLAIDWGTSNRRAYRLDPSGRIVDRMADARGVLSLSRDDYLGEVETLRQRFGVARIVAAGMVGSTHGWRETRYVRLPATLDALAATAVEVSPGVTILPGVATRTGDRPDVMRGEEIQALGAVAGGLIPDDAIVCQPGTHSKWLRIVDGRIVDVATAMTGEVFALLRSGGILAGTLDEAVVDGNAFRDGVRRGSGARDLLSALFEVRAGVLLGVRPAAEAAARASGTLIGSDVGSRADVPGRRVHLLASGPLAPLYAAAIEEVGGTAVSVDCDDAFCAGIHAVRGTIG